MPETILTISPDTYQFINLEEATSINIKTNATNVQFIRANNYGTGGATFDFSSKIITAKQYGLAVYKFIATAEGGEEKTAYFNLEVKRPLLGKQVTEKIYVPVNGNGAAWNYKPPQGYRLKLLDFQDLKPPLFDFEVDSGSNVIIQPKTVGLVTCNIIVEKENPLDGEEKNEYITGTLTVDIYNFIIKPKSTILYSKINKTVTVDTLKIILGSTNKGGQLQFTTDLTNTDILELTPTELNDEIDGYSYSLTIKTFHPGEGKINVIFNKVKLAELSITIEDVKLLAYKPKITGLLKLAYNQTYTLTGIQYDNNDVYEDVEIINTDTRLLETVLTTTDEDNKIYSLTIKNVRSQGGTGSFTIKSIHREESKEVINVKCWKEVIPGVITSSPAVRVVTIHEQTSFTVDWVSLTNADDVILVIGDTTIVDARLEELTSIPMKPNGIEPIEFPPNSIQRQLFLFGKLPGSTTITIKGIVNENDVSSTVEIKVKVLPNDELSNTAKLVNLETDTISRIRKGDIVINLPVDNSVLVLKEQMQQNLVIEFGYSFDYVNPDNPTKLVNPTTISKNTGNAIWLNSTTGEVFTCFDNTPDNNKWKGNKGTYINHIEYPNPGEKGFGVGPAPEGLAERYELSPLEGTFDRNSDVYGNYKAKDNSLFVFIPKHYIIPKFDPELVKYYPYDGMSYEFSWVPIPDKFTDVHIPRCFINNGVIQDGIFISKYNSNRFQEYLKEDTYTLQDDNKLTATSGMHSIYPVVLTGSSRRKKWHTVIPNDRLYPELYIMAKTLIPVGENKNQLGRHNMTIFIQTMLANLGDLHTIASYEKSAIEEVCYKLKYLVSGTWVRELAVTSSSGAEQQKYNPVKRFFIGDKNIRYETIHFGPESGSIKYEYQRLFSHNGQYCGVYDIGGPINTPLPGILVVQDDISSPNSYKVYSLKKEVDITDIERKTFNAVKNTNTQSVVYRSQLFNLNNYDLIANIVNNEEVSKLLYMDNNNAYYTHLNDVSLLEGNIEQYNSINAGLNLGSLTTFTSGNYTTEYTPVIDRAMRTSKFKYSVYNMGFLSKKESMRLNNTIWYGMFTSNYVPNTEEATIGNFPLEGIYNGYRTRVLRHIGSFRYFKKNSSEYMFGMRTCITPNIKP